MRIWFDPHKLSAYGLTPDDVQTALLTRKCGIPAGKITGNATELRYEHLED